MAALMTSHLSVSALAYSGCIARILRSLRLTFCSRSPPSGELFQEPQIVLIKVANVIDAVEEHREALEAHAEGVAAPNLRIVADRVGHRRIHHAAAAYFDPWLLHLRQMGGRQIHFEARLRVAKEVGTKTRLGGFAEQRGE